MISFLQKLSPLRFIKSRENLQIQDIIFPFILAASLVGLVPHSVKFSKSNHAFKIIPFSIYLNCLCCVSIVVVLFTFGCIHVKYMLGSEEKSQFNIEVTTQLNYIMEVIIFDIFCCATFIFVLFYRSTYVKIFNMTVSTWRSIPTTKESPTILGKLYLQRNIMMLGLLLTLVTQICVNLTRKDGGWKKTLVTITFNIPQLIQFILHAYYTMLVLAVAGILENVNSHCRLFVDTEFSPNSRIEVQPKSKRMSMRQMELTYMKAFDIKSEINRAFEGPMLASILQSFHAVVSEAHILYHGLLVQRTITIHEVMNCSTWIIYQFIKIYSLAYSGRTLQLEALKTGQILHRIPTERQDLRWYMEVQHFSALLKYQSIEINVYGYFPLDATLIFNMFASATMYLIILVQFDNHA